MHTYHDVIAQLERDMKNNGFFPPEIILDGKIHRFSKDGKFRQQSCWYIGTSIQLSNGKWAAFCTYSDWKISEKFKFNSTSEFTDVEIAEIRKEKVEFEKAQADIESKIFKKAQNTVKYILQNSKPVVTHDYLSKKKISNPMGVKIYKGSLVIPMRSLDGDSTGLQFIASCGKKRFIKGQKNKGSFFIIGHEKDLNEVRSVNVVEGIATGFSVFEAERKTVICTFTKGNIEAVCSSLKERYPLIKIKICADNDRFSEGNPGLTTAKQVAKKHHTSVTFPEFDQDDEMSTDFNDLHRKMGLEEVRKQLSKASYITAEVPPPSQLAEEFLTARGLVKANRPILRYWQNEFYQYDNGKYLHLSGTDLFSRVINYLQMGGARSKANTKTTTDVISNLKGHSHLDGNIQLPCWLDKSGRNAKDYISMKNGLLNLNKWSLGITDFMEEHTPNFLTLAQIPFDYNSDAKCPLWLKFLAEVQPDPIARKMLQQWFGYNLVNDVSFHKFLILYGEGANGKSVVCTVLKTLLGNENVSATTLESIDPKRTFPLAATMGKLANIVGELNATDKTAEGELKKFVAGEAMTVERKFGHPFTFIPTARLTFATNVLPRFVDTSDGLWRRVLLLPFEVQTIDPEKQNRNLVDSSWWKDSGELPGIFNWALAGLKDLYENGRFAESDASLAAKDKYRSDSNPTRTFLLDTFKEESGAEISTRKVYQQYSVFMHANGHHPMANNRLSDEVKRAFPGVIVTKNPHALPLKEQGSIEQSRSRLYIGLSEKKE